MIPPGKRMAIQYQLVGISGNSQIVELLDVDTMTEVRTSRAKTKR
jgi:hypothetical protein